MDNVERASSEHATNRRRLTRQLERGKGLVLRNRRRANPIGQQFGDGAAVGEGDLGFVGAIGYRQAAQTAKQPFLFRDHRYTYSCFSIHCQLTLFCL